MSTAYRDGIHFHKIPYRSIRTFIKKQIACGVSTFNDLHPTYVQGMGLQRYQIHEDSFHVPVPREEVWNHYLTADPNLAWNGKIINFALMLSKSDGKIMYRHDQYSGAKVGQVFYLNLSILGLLHIGVAHQIIGIDHDSYFFELSYVEGSESRGKQRISFHATSIKSTKIVHTTHYRSDSSFRDRYVYPYFHDKAIHEYHENMERSLIKGTSSSLGSA